MRPNATRSASRAVRNDRSAATTKIASSRFVLPWPLSPTKTLNRSRGSSRTGRRLRTPSRASAQIRSFQILIGMTTPRYSSELTGRMSPGSSSPPSAIVIWSLDICPSSSTTYFGLNPIAMFSPL